MDITLLGGWISPQLLAGYHPNGWLDITQLMSKPTNVRLFHRVRLTRTIFRTLIVRQMTDTEKSTLGEEPSLPKKQKVEVDLKGAANRSYNDFAGVDWNNDAMANKFVELTKGNLVYKRQDIRGSGNMYVYHESRWRQDDQCEIVKAIYTRTMRAFFEAIIPPVDRYLSQVWFTCNWPL